MNFTLTKEVLEIIGRFQKTGFQIYVVGGAVRDLLMGRKVRDWDFTTDAKPEEILKIFPEGFYDNKFGTVGVPAGHLPGEQLEHLEGGVYEITTMRKEGAYQDFRHPDKILCTNKIEDDLARRDFTINAIALEFSEQLRKAQKTSKSDDSKIRYSDVLSHSDLRRKGVLPFRLVDPYHGQKDLNDGLIRAVGDPNKRFKEDALRLIRAVRISAELGFEIEKNTLKGISNHASLIKQIAYERIRDELFKILSADNPYLGISKLKEVRILQIILPELERCFGIYQKGPKHAREYDIGEHSLLALKYTPSDDVITRFAALLHDIGKPDTKSIEEDGNVTFYNHEVFGGNISLNIAKRFNLSNKQTDKLYRLIRWHMFSVSEHQTDSAIRRFIKNVGKENLEAILCLRVGDRLGGGTQKETSWRTERFKDRVKQVLKKPFTITDLKITGFDVMKILNIKPGPKVGQILQGLFEEVLKDSSKNKREYLLKKAAEIK